MTRTTTSSSDETGMVPSEAIGWTPVTEHAITPQNPAEDAVERTAGVMRRREDY